MKKTILCLSALAAGVSLAFAGPVEDREALMKERAGLMRQISPMAKGEEAFDAAKAQQILDQLAENARPGAADELFPEGTQEGTEASPAIWEDFAAFEAAWEKYAADTAAAAASKPQDQAALAAAVGQIGANCGSCHQPFRISNN
ncbi:MAG TPA: cytochrome c [Mesorhizobium sp.]|jgi:cytochrome c556|nr:cytochrome c [Mesorhizobium sp.]